MNIKSIRQKISVVSKTMDKNEQEKLEKDNESLQDFVLWLMGYLDGTEEAQVDEIKKIREKIEKIGKD